MNKPTSNSHAYLETKVLTASPEQLQLMLYDGAIRFCEQAKTAIDAGEVENSYLLITRAEKIVMELQGSMRDEVAPETCANMRRLYLFCYDRMVTANLKKDINALDEAIEVLKNLRETWMLLIEKLKDERADELEASDSTAPDAIEGVEQEVGATINFEG